MLFLQAITARCARSTSHKLVTTSYLSTRHGGLYRFPARRFTGLSAQPLPFPVIQTCPEPTCACAPTPQDLDIEKDKDINGTMAPYTEHVIVSTGHRDWKRKVEDEKDVPGWGEFIYSLKKAVGLRGEFHDVRRSSNRFL